MTVKRIEDDPSMTLLQLLESSPWYTELEQSAQARVLDEMREEDLPHGIMLWQLGEVPRKWYGVMRGLLSVSMTTADGASVSYGVLTIGSWFGEGSIVRAVPRHEEVIAVRHSRVAVMPFETFDWLYRSQIAFCQFLVAQMSERLYWFMGGHSAHKHLSSDGRVARALVGLYHPRLSPMMGRRIGIPQEMIASMSGLSRSRCSEALGRLQEAGLIHLDYRELTILDLDGLRQLLA